MTTENSEANEEAQREKASTLLTNALVCATVPTTDLQRARRFYEETLGLKAAISDERRGVYYQAGGGTMLNLYERQHSTAEYSVATFLVENLDEVMSDLRSRSVSFEEYDMPDLKTENGVYSDQTGFKVSWFKDPDGNIIGIEQLPSR
ncbi:MAG: VOC family protein [Ferruginibacter sp.]|nr:VOC family protein [Cytophagales bacterium]